MQGPHHGAQQSTKTGMSLWFKTALTFAAVRSTDLPEKTGDLHFPHLGLSPKRSLGIRFFALHLEQVTLVVVICSCRFLDGFGDSRGASYGNNSVRESNYLVNSFRVPDKYN